MTKLKKRSISLYGHRTSIALEEDFWFVLEKIAQQKKHSLAGFIAQIDKNRLAEQSLSSILRVTALRYVATSNTPMCLPNIASDNLIYILNI